MLRRQAKLSLSITVVFGLLLVGLPLANLFAKDLVSTKLGGFSLTWLLLGVVFFPVTWILSTIFVRSSNEMERLAAIEHREDLSGEVR